MSWKVPKALILLWLPVLGGCSIFGGSDEPTEKREEIGTGKVHVWTGTISQADQDVDGSIKLLMLSLDDSSIVQVSLRKTPQNIWFIPSTWGYETYRVIIMQPTPGQYLGFEYKIVVARNIVQ